jgi:ParB family chromosome partitioning protein
LLVRPQGDGYELVAGERRYRAAKEVGLTEVPVTVREMNDTEARQFALVENLQREDLNPVDQTEGILALLEVRLERSREEVIALLNQIARANRGLTDNVVREEDLDAVSGVFVSVGRLTPESFRTHRLPLLNLPQDVLDALREGKIEYTKAKAIAQVKDDDTRGQLLEEAIALALSLSEIRDRVKALKTPVAEEAPGVETIRKRANRVARLVKDKELEDDAKRQELDKLLARIEKLLSRTRGKRADCRLYRRIP